MSYEFYRAQDAAARLGHVLGAWCALAPGHASAECRRPGCGMGVTLDNGSAAGAAVTYPCPALAPVAVLTLA